MNRASVITADRTAFGIAIIAAVIAVSTLVGWYGGFVAAIVGWLALVCFGLWLVDYAVRMLTHWLNRLCRACREASSQKAKTEDCDVPGVAYVGLRDNLAMLRRAEAECLLNYEHHMCSFDDVLRIRSLRLIAEIELTRYEKMPKGWGE